MSRAERILAAVEETADLYDGQFSNRAEVLAAIEAVLRATVPAIAATEAGNALADGLLRRHGAQLRTVPLGPRKEGT